MPGQSALGWLESAGSDSGPDGRCGGSHGLNIASRLDHRARCTASRSR